MIRRPGLISTAIHRRQTRLALLIRKPSFKRRPLTASNFRCTSILAGPSKLKETSTPRSLNIKTPSPSSKASGEVPLHPADEALAHRRIAGAMDRQGRFVQAETHYKKALKISPKDPKIWNDAGYSYYLQGRWVDAERALKTAVRLSPDDDRIRTNLGLTLAAAGRTDEALPLLSQSNGDAIGHANLGYLLAASGQFDLARRQYQQALTLRPDLQLAQLRWQDWTLTSAIHDLGTNRTRALLRDCGRRPIPSTLT